MKKNVKLLIAIIILAVAIVGAIRLFSKEDDWTCDFKAQWVRHGSPSAEMPKDACK